MQYFGYAPVVRLGELGGIGLMRARLNVAILTPWTKGIWQAMTFDFSVRSAFDLPAVTDLDIRSTNGLRLPPGRFMSPPFRGGQEENGLPGEFRCWTDWTLCHPFDSSRVNAIAAAAQRSFDLNWYQ